MVSLSAFAPLKPVYLGVIAFIPFSQRRISPNLFVVHSISLVRPPAVHWIGLVRSLAVAVRSVR